METLPIPMYDRVLVRKIEVEHKSAGGILIPDKVVAQKNIQQKEGVILKTGPGYRNNDGSITPLHVKEGDEIYFNHFAGVDIPYGEEKLVLMREEEILGIKKRAQQVIPHLTPQQKLDAITALHESMRETLTQNHPGEWAIFEFAEEANEPVFVMSVLDEKIAKELKEQRLKDYPNTIVEIFPIGIV